MKHREKLGFFFILLLLFFLGGCGKEPAAKIGDVAPDFTLPTLGGQEITLGQYNGKNIFLLFWTQGCVFCQTRGIIMVNDIYRQGQQSELVVLSINVAESKGEVAEFVRQRGLTYPVLMDRDASVSRKKYGVYVVPTLFIIGKDRMIKEKVYGYLTEQALLDFVEPYLKKKD
jgi:cytochrome c biogenesis protein CcmG/thiol:disulfide interchange protein DsbE